MLYFIANGFFHHTGWLQIVCSVCLLAFFLFWLYTGIGKSKRRYYPIFPCIAFAFAALLDYLSVLELFPNRSFFNLRFLSAFLDGGFARHPFVFGGFFLLAFLIGVVLCIRECAGLKDFFVIFRITTSIGFFLGFLLTLFFAGFFYMIVAILLFYILIAYTF